VLSWTQIREDLYHGIILLRKGMLRAALYSSQETDRLNYRYRLQAADRQLAEAYCALGKYVLTRIQVGQSDFMKEKEWFHWIKEIESRREELESLTAERETFDREEEPEGP
jgi:hypothetical protein